MCGVIKDGDILVAINNISIERLDLVATTDALRSLERLCKVTLFCIMQTHSQSSLKQESVKLRFRYGDIVVKVDEMTSREAADSDGEAADGLFNLNGVLGLDRAKELMADASLLTSLLDKNNGSGGRGHRVRTPGPSECNVASHMMALCDYLVCTQSTTRSLSVSLIRFKTLPVNDIAWEATCRLAAAVQRLVFSLTRLSTSW
jgi:hypothetical protein